MTLLGIVYRGAERLESAALPCPRCGKTAMLSAYATRAWLRLFGVTLLPLGRFRIKEHCAACNRLKRTRMSSFRRELRRGLVSLRRAVEREPRNGELHAALVGSLLQLGEEREAQAALARGLESAPDSPALGLLEARRRATLGQTEQALAALDGAVERAPERFSARLLRGRLLLGIGRLEQAAVELKQARRLAPRDAAPHFLLGDCHERLGRWSEALKYYEELLGRRPELRRDPAVLRRLFRCKLALGFRLTPEERATERRMAVTPRGPSPVDAERLAWR